MVDFGCAEGELVKRLQFQLKQFDEIAAVDLDAKCTSTTKSELKASVYDDYFLDRRTKNLTIDVYRGSCADFDARLADVDAVTMIEL